MDGGLMSAKAARMLAAGEDRRGLALVPRQTVDGVLDVKRPSRSWAMDARGGWRHGLRDVTECRRLRERPSTRTHSLHESRARDISSRPLDECLARSLAHPLRSSRSAIGAGRWPRRAAADFAARACEESECRPRRRPDWRPSGRVATLEPWPCVRPMTRGVAVGNAVIWFEP
jgi:hypothetical protein